MNAQNIWSAGRILALLWSLTARTGANQSPNTAALSRSGPHTGAPAQALVGIEVLNVSADGKTRQTRHGNGCILRCDGFVLAPSALFSLVMSGRSENAGKQTITLELHPGTEQAKRLTLRRPRFFPSQIGYVAFKLPDIHTPALRALLPDLLKPGDAVEVVWCGWDEIRGAFRAPQHRAVQIGTARGGRKLAPGMIAFGEPLEPLPAGALVVGPEEMGVGMTVGGGPVHPAEFLSFASLHQATNCVTPLPTPDKIFFARSARRGAPDSAEEPVPEGVGEMPARSHMHLVEGMVEIPGGQLALPEEIRNGQTDLEGAATVCMAPFLIDKFAVTNAQYRTFWNSLKPRERLERFRELFPWGWEEKGDPFPDSLANLPVLGVPLAGAREYARAQGKRLPTPYEWVLAALGPGGQSGAPEWTKRYAADRRDTWYRVRAQHLEFARANPDLFMQDLLDGAPVPIISAGKELQPGAHAGGRIPWVAQSSLRLPASIWSKEVVERETSPLWDTWRNPLYVQRGGSRDFDASPYGVMDVLLNGQKLVAPPAGPPYYGESTYITTTWQTEPYAKNPLFVPFDYPERRPLLDIQTQWDVPLLSCLMARELLTPSADYILTLSNLYETSALLAPVTGWSLRMTKGAPAALAWNHPAEFRITPTALRDPRTGKLRTLTPADLQSFLDIYSREVLGAGYKLWARPPLHYQKQMGRMTPLEGPAEPLDPTITGQVPLKMPADLVYLFPGTFRCAR